MEEIKHSLVQMQQMFQHRMQEFTDELHKTPSSKPSLEVEFNNFKTFVLAALQALQAQVELLDLKTDDLEMHSRRKILLVHGHPEDKKEDITAVVVKIIVDHFKLLNFTSNNISRCHRMGKSSPSDKPRPILIKLKDMAVRSKVWSSKSLLKGSGITLSEFLTKARHDIFMAARQKVGVTRAWTRNSKVFVLASDDTRHQVNSMADLSKLEVGRAKKNPMSVVTEAALGAAATRSRRDKAQNKKA